MTRSGVQGVILEKPPKKKLKLSSGPDFLTLNLDGNGIEVLKPGTWKDKDVSVLLDAGCHF